MHPYPYDDMLMNGRVVAINDIVNRTVAANSDFEQKTFDFISDWVQEKESFVQNTSGSTGDPKQIIITRKQMTASAKMSIEALTLRRGYNALLCISPDYIGGKMMLVRSLVAGMKIIACTPSSNPLAKLAPNQHIDFAAMVPYQIHEVIRSDSAFKFNEIKAVIIGGAAVDSETIEKLQGYRCVFYSTYGMTETVSHIALRQLNENNASECYTVLPGIHISVDERSCLVIEWNQLSQKIVTNDIVEIVNSGSFRWIGRWDNVINTGGVKVFPEKVENIVKEIFRGLHLDNSFFVGSVADLKLGSKVTLFIEGKISKEAIVDVEREIALKVPKNEAPKQAILVPSFVLTENGKVNRKATAKPYMGEM
jgi:O-succinylbenzoic acid--CoA ligase